MLWLGPKEQDSMIGCRFKKLSSILKKKDTSQTLANHCQCGKTYTQDGLDAVLKLKCSINANNARHKADGRMEVRIVGIACGSVPEGHSRWTNI